jgi:hypothetical protein
LKQWVTELKALDPHSGEMKKWCGPEVQAPTAELAQKWCDENCGYLKVIGELVAEIPCKRGTYEPDFKNMTDYENIQNN